jgi:hypothetical protein
LGNPRQVKFKPLWHSTAILIMRGGGVVACRCRAGHTSVDIGKGVGTIGPQASGDADAHLLIVSSAARFDKHMRMADTKIMRNSLAKILDRQGVSQPS